MRVKSQWKNILCTGAVCALLAWTVFTILKEQTPGQLAHALLSADGRILLLALGTLFASLGCAFYMTADMGISPYDSVALIITKYTRERISFRLARVLSDVTVIVVGVVFFLMSHGSIWAIVGLGTIVNACCNGPLIQFFRERISKLAEKEGKIA